jgi:hypothetical protein
MLSARSPEHIPLTAESLYPLTNFSPTTLSLPTPAQPLVATILPVLLWVWLFLDSTRKWGPCSICLSVSGLFHSAHCFIIIYLVAGLSQETRTYYREGPVWFIFIFPTPSLPPRTYTTKVCQRRPEPQVSDYSYQSVLPKHCVVYRGKPLIS